MPTPVGITSTTSAPTSSSSAATVRTASSSSLGVMPPGSGVPVPGMNAGVEHVDVDRQVDRPGPDGGDRARDDLADAEVADVVGEQARDPVLGLPGELLLAGPVAAQADLGVAGAVELPAVDQPADERPVRALDAEHLGAGVRVRVEVDHPDRPVDRGDGAHGRLGDRVVAAEHERDHAGGEHLADGRLDRGVRDARVGRDHGRVAEVDDAQLGERVDLRLEVRARRAARRRGSRAARGARPGGRRRGRPSARRRSRRRSPRARPGPRCRPCRRTSAARGSRASRRTAPSAPADRSMGHLRGASGPAF